MHQPFYKDLLTGDYRLPWTRMHALKDYYGMVKILEEFPTIHQTFNLVPSLVVQVEEYASGKARDPFFTAAVTPAEKLTEEQRHFILSYFFQANRERLIHRYPRYRELFERWEGAGGDAQHAAHYFSLQDYRDLQVLSQLAWFDEEFLEHDPEVAALVDRGSDYTLEDQQVMARKQREILQAVLAVYREAAERRQIEISTTPFYHPILPLLCDSDIGAEAHPGLPLPQRFRRPEDAREQLRRARDFMAQRLARPPVGLWPSEGSVSDEVLSLAAETGFEWAATDQGVLEKTLRAACAGPGGRLYQPFLWQRDNRRLHLLFRDHFLSDLIGFVFSRMDPEHAAEDFVRRLYHLGEPHLQAGRDALIPVILDGENAWEYYDRNGRPFLRALYRRLARDPRFSVPLIAEAIRRLPAEPLHHISPGSWINANFDIWIGAPEDNRAWNLLSQARQHLDRATHVSPKQYDLAYEEILIAEGSDWCWWYGPEHETANRVEFDELFRAHLSNVYRALGGEPPDELARPVIRAEEKALLLQPTGFIRPVVDGEITSYFEWIGAGVYRASRRTGAMHGRRFLVQEIHFGTDGASFYLRVDFLPHELAHAPGMEIRLTLESPERARYTLVLGDGQVRVEEGDPNALEARFARVLEVRIPLPASGSPLRFQLSLWHEGLPLDALPAEGWIELETTESAEWTV
jgi:alpha-amylase/alpha-mannosidase (GH57 family)